MYKVMKAFVCRSCISPVTGTGCTSVDTGVGVAANLELVVIHLLSGEHGEILAILEVGGKNWHAGAQKWQYL